MPFVTCFIFWSALKGSGSWKLSSSILMLIRSKKEEVRSICVTRIKAE